MHEESLFEAALTIATAAERQAFLENACAGNVSLKGEWNKPGAQRCLLGLLRSAL
jgi:hypothetical protein